MYYNVGGLSERKLQARYLTWVEPGTSPLLRWLNVEQLRSVISPQVRTHNIFFTCSFLHDPLHLSNLIAQAQHSTGCEDLPSQTSRHTLSSSQSLGMFLPTSFYPLYPLPFAYPTCSYVLSSLTLLCSCFSPTSLLIILKQECQAMLLSGPSS